MPQMSSLASASVCSVQNKATPQQKKRPWPGCPAAACRSLARWRPPASAEDGAPRVGRHLGHEAAGGPRSEPACTAAAPLGWSHRCSVLIALACPPSPTRERRETPASLSLTGSGSSRRRRQGGLPRCLPVRLGRRGGGRGACAGGASVGGSGSEGWAGGVRAVQPPGWHAGRRAPRHWGGLRIFEPRAAHYQGIGQAAAVRGGGQSRAEEGFRKSPFTLGHRCFVRLG